MYNKYYIHAQTKHGKEIKLAEMEINNNKFSELEECSFEKGPRGFVCLLVCLRLNYSLEKLKKKKKRLMFKLQEGWFA